MRGRCIRWGVPSVWTWWAVAAVAAGFWVVPSATAQERPREERRLVEILEGLEHGLVALERLGLGELHEQLRLVADDVRGEIMSHRQGRGREPGARGPDRAPRRLAEELHELLAVNRDEYAGVQQKIAELTNDNKVIRQVISKIRDDLPLEGAGDRQQRERAEATLADYQRRLKENEQHLEALHGQRARLEEMFRRLEAASPDLEARARRAERGDEAHARDERLRQLSRHVDETLERSRQGRGERPGLQRTERQVAESQIEALQLALPALREAERRDAVELVERAIEARKTGLEGRRGEEARRIRQRGPGREQILEILVQAEAIYREFEMDERAGQLSRMTEALWPQRERRRPQARTGSSDEAAHALEVMRIALPALKEAGRHDSAELLQRAIRAREVRLEGRQDDEAAAIRQAAPTPAQQVELLAYAADLWQKFGHEEKAAVVRELAERMRSSLRQGGDERGGGEPRREARVRRDALLPRIEKLEHRLAEIEQSLDRINAHLRATGQQRR